MNEEKLRHLERLELMCWSDSEGAELIAAAREANRMRDTIAWDRTPGLPPVPVLQERYDAVCKRRKELDEENERLRRVCDDRPEAFLKHLESRAKELVPDYPYAKDDAFDWLWALSSAYEGTCLANDDCHKEIARLRARVEALEKGLSDLRKYAGNDMDDIVRSEEAFRNAAALLNQGELK